MSERIFYFGCWSPREKGHFLYPPTGRSIWPRSVTPELPFTPEMLDGGRFLPFTEYRERSKRWESKREPQSVFRLTHESGWTLIGSWDRSADERGASNATFLAEGTHDRETMIGLARKHFAAIVDRIENAAPITWETP